MQFQLTKDRKFTRLVTVHIPNEQGEFDQSTLRATFRIAPTDEVVSSEKRLLDLVLVDLPELEQEGFSKAELLEAVKNDPCAGPALIREYNEAVAKKNYG
ncbi:hypothetical protein QCD60_23985 [Pokkaliibacter sp. MBI-7]|uniref:hypothetical protein n=1 Tax=Pokkaliibacter sp. MBI-7 TaxID=3040600 RepID=UPI00244BAACE|nr:hypothetical protein [Pokkaliibacter sp. MBI-7]MDH2435589.1 hypothetical protein [Pokkaliibacter sp. MBI-7]